MLNKMAIKKEFNIAIMPGDGIGPEVINAAVSVLEVLALKLNIRFNFNEYLIGGAAYDAVGKSLPDLSVAAAKMADAVLVGPVGGPQWDYLDIDKKPERSLINLRNELQCYASLRPVKLLPQLLKNSPLRQRIISKGLDCLIVRELSAGLYAGNKGRMGVLGTLNERAFDVETYEASEIVRIAQCAFEQARNRRKKLCSIDKANLLESSRLWRETVQRLSGQYPDVELECLYVDSAFTKLLEDPSHFDVILCNNIFGDIASDISASLSGSYPSLPSSALSYGSFPSIFEAVHGSAPDLAGKDEANPIGAILSGALMMLYSFNNSSACDLIYDAVNKALESGYRTKDLLSPAEKDYFLNPDHKKKLEYSALEQLKIVGCKEMTENIIGQLKLL